MASNRTRSLRTIDYNSVIYQPTLYTIILLLVFWQLLSLSFAQRDLPSVLHLAELVYMVVVGNGEFSFVEHASITTQRILIGFVITMSLGVPLGIMMGISRYSEFLTVPVMVLLTFPAVVWAFILVMWFGVTEYLNMVAVIVLAVTPYVAVNVWKGAESIDEGLLEMGETFGLSTAGTWKHIVVPSLLPFLFSSGRLAFALAWKLSLVAEIFGSYVGIGFVVNYYFTAVRADMILAWSLPMMVAMFGIERVLKLVEEQAFEWRPEVDGAQTNIETA